jgi:hypothetical protein
VTTRPLPVSAMMMVPITSTAIPEGRWNGELLSAFCDVLTDGIYEYERRILHRDMKSIRVKPLKVRFCFRALTGSHDKDKHG